MNCFAALIKYILYILNVIFLVFGALLITLGAIMINNVDSFGVIDQHVNVNIIPILLMTIGGLIFITSFIGCCGTIRENACLTTTYAVLLFMMFALQVTLTVWIFMKRAQLLKTMGNAVETVWEQNDNANGYPMDALQYALKCCGNQGYKDYLDKGQKPPGTCCGYTDRNQTCSAEIYEQRPPCKDEFVHFWATNTNIIRWSGIAIAIFELAVFTVACCLAGSMRRSGSR